MWKPLKINQSVRPGDKIRYISLVQHIREAHYQVVKTDLHYFVIGPVMPCSGSGTMNDKVVRYFDLGYNVFLEVWTQ